MPTEANKQTAKEFFEAMSTGDVGKVFAFLSPDATWWIPTDQPGGMTVDVAAIHGLVGGFFSVFDEAPAMELGRMTAEDDRVCFEQTARGGRTRGGAGYGNDYHMLLRFRDGLICEVREYMNPLLSAAIAAEIGASRR